jgi:hypothetical protein
MPHHSSPYLSPPGRTRTHHSPPDHASLPFLFTRAVPPHAVPCQTSPFPAMPCFPTFIFQTNPTQPFLTVPCRAAPRLASLYLSPTPDLTIPHLSTPCRVLPNPTLPCFPIVSTMPSRHTTNLASPLQTTSDRTMPCFPFSLLPPHPDIPYLVRPVLALPNQTLIGDNQWPISTT